MLSLLSRLPIRVKVLIAPLIVMLLGIAVAAGSVWLLRSQGQAFRAVVGGTLDTATTTSRLALTVAGMHSDVLRRVDLLAARQDTAALAELRGTLAARFDAMEAMLQSIETNDTSVDAELLHSVQEFLSIYRIVVMRVMRSETLNPTLVSSLLAHYKQLDNYLGELADRSIRAAKQTQAATERRVGEALRLLLALVLASVALGLLATWVIARAIAKPLTEMTTAMSRLAEGDFDVRVPAAGRRDEVGAMAAAVEVFRAASQRLHAHDAQLAVMVDELGRARDQAAEANRAKSEFLARMSHELRTPLNAILGYAQILQWEKGLSAKSAAGLKTIEQAGQHLLSLIDEILDLARIEAGKLELQLAPLEPASFLDAIANIVRVRIEHKGVDFVLDAGALPRSVLADERRLRQVLLNLLGNAAKFTDRGQVALRVRRLESAPGTARLLFEVVDTGIGIAADDLASLFQAFQQVGEARRRRGGTGLGLAISRQLVRAMGGDIDVQSTPGKGSSFSFDLTLQEVPAELPVGPPPRVLGYEGPRQTILVVDDVAENRQLLVDLLRPLGFVTAVAEDGRQGVAQAQALHPNLVLMDHVMPVMDGNEATRRIRADPALRDVPVIAVSASVGDGGAERALAAGANAFMRKPFRADELVDLLEQHLPIRFVREGG